MRQKSARAGRQARGQQCGSGLQLPWPIPAADARPCCSKHSACSPNPTAAAPAPPGSSHLHAVGRSRRQQQGAGEVQVGEGLPVRHVQHDAAGRKQGSTQAR